MTNDTTHSTPPPHQPPQAPHTTETTSGLAIASLVLGIVSFTGFFLFTGIPAIITGAIALKKGQGERAMSIAGIIMGSIATLLSLLFIAFFVLLFVLGAMSGPSAIPQDSPATDLEFPMESSRT